MIEEGRIALDGEVLTTPATLLADLKGVTVDGKPVEPAGGGAPVPLLQAAGRADRRARPQGPPDDLRPAARRPAAADPGRPPRFHDRGAAADDQRRRVEAPARAAEHRRGPHLSRPRVRRRHPGRSSKQLAEGVTIEGMRYGSIDANLERRTGRNCWIEMTLTEGKNREVRNVLAFLGLQVSRLIRTAYGPFTVEGLEPGEVGEVAARGSVPLPPDARNEDHRRPMARAPAGRARPANSTRPTADRTRETLFSMLASRLGSFEGLRVADLYAGSGALGLEALSRGAARRHFVENDRARARRDPGQCSPRSARATAIEMSRDVGGSACRARSRFDLIFADPPYAPGSGTRGRRGGRRGRTGSRPAAGWRSRPSAATPVDPGRSTIEAERDVGRARLTLLRASLGLLRLGVRPCRGGDLDRLEFARSAARRSRPRRPCRRP